MPIDETQLTALIDAAVREAVGRTARELTAKHEAETEGLRRKRDELLGERKPWQDSLDAADAVLARSAETLRLSREQEQRWASRDTNAAMPSAVREHTITRDQARSGQAYREAKEAAEKAGVPLRIVDENAPTAAVTTSPVRLIHDETSGILHANKRMISATPGGLPRLRQLAAEKNSQLRLFRTVDDLPRDAAAKHAQIIADQVRDNLLGDDQ